MHESLLDLPTRAGPGLLHVVVDTPRGSGNKYKFDEKRGCYVLGRILPKGLVFPYDFGSIPGTAAEDGDPLDLVVLAELGTFVGCVVTVRLVGVIEAEQAEKRETIRNDRLLGVIVTPVNQSVIRRLGDVPARELAELEQFFADYNRAHGRKWRPLARRGATAAERLVRASERRFRERRHKGE
jgi:inorganic pyrophosphatase